MGRGPSSGGSPRQLAIRRLTRVALFTTGGLVAGTVVQVATGDPVWSAAGAGAGAVIAVVLNRVGPRRVR
ncbi:MAG: hypothetical protein IT200_11605 [Thermoleophilia bacterium]|nr:hypothetical protein [Thermoleophilia bacterium]